MKLVKKILLGLLIIVVVAQFFRPEKNNGNYSSLNSFIEETKPTDEVLTILKTSCFDCHSNTTNYPWYNNITPVNYWINDHVEHGKSHLNFSLWDDYSNKIKQEKLEELVEEIEENHMPLPSYLKLHENAELTKTEKRMLEKWVKMANLKYIFSNNKNGWIKNY